MNWSIWEAVLLDGVFAAVAAIGFSVISNPPKQAIFISALLAAIGHGLRFYLLHYMDVPLIPATLVAAFTIGMFSIFFARLIHCPAEVFSFPSLLPMIPGMYAYKTILAFIRFMNSTEDNPCLHPVHEQHGRGSIAAINRGNFPEWFNDRVCADGLGGGNNLTFIHIP